MDIILQNYAIEAKNFLFFEISKYIKNITMDFIDNLFRSDNKYIAIINSLTKAVRELVKAIILSSIKFFNQKFIEDEYRRGKWHINVRNDHRSINIAGIGQLDFTRTYFEKADGSEYFYFIDELFSFDKYDRYDCITKANSIDLAMKTNQKLAGEILNDNTSVPIDENFVIPRQTIHKWIKEWKIPMIKYEPIKFDGDTLYVMADEKWIHEQIKLNREKEHKKYYLMSKQFVCFTGIKNIGKQRRLVNRFIFMTASSNPWDEFLDGISQIYDFEKLEKIVFLSDAGKWLVSGAPDLKLFSQNKVVMCLCEFHAKQKINRITTDKDLRVELAGYLDDNEKKKFTNKMKEINENAKDENRLKKLEEYEKYITKNWSKIQNMNKSEYGSSMESHISHYLASYFSSRPKAFSANTIQKYIKLQEAKANGIDIKLLYLKTYNNEDENYTLNEKELDYSMFEKSNSSNMPIIEYGLSTNLYQFLRGLAH